MARLPLADVYLRDRTLVCAYDRKVRSRDSYFLLHPPSSERQKKIQVFRDWIIAEAAKSPYHIPHHP
jgi:LysR family glycine cleavage system transcriptional activator